jgi:hypothetical protein
VSENHERIGFSTRRSRKIKIKRRRGGVWRVSGMTNTVCMRQKCAGRGKKDVLGEFRREGMKRKEIEIENKIK